MVAKASGPEFDFPAKLRFFSHFFVAFFLTPLGEKVSIYCMSTMTDDNDDGEVYP